MAIMGLMGTLMPHGNDDGGASCLVSTGGRFAQLHAATNNAVAEVTTAHTVFKGADGGQ